jgi:ribosomal protein S18 acetylase RimI-like enzyme
MTVRDASAGDARAIAEIRVASWRATYAGVVPQPILDGLDSAGNEAWLARRLADRGPTTTLVVEEGGRVRGYALLAPAHDPDAAGFGEVEAIYLAPGFTGRGLGRALMDEALTRLRAAGHAAAVLWVLTANGGARRFYEAAGFTPDGAARALDFDGTPIEEMRYRRSIG